MKPHPGGSDTDPRAERVHTEHLRRLTASEKLNQVFDLNELALALHRAGLRKRHPNATAAELDRLSVRERYGEAAEAMIFSRRAQ